MAIKCAFFDFDGVLRNWDYDMDGLEENYGISLEAFREVAFAPENVEPAIRGEISDQEWRVNVGRILSARFPDRDVKAASDFWTSRTGELVPEVLEIIRACKNNVSVGLMTNATSRLNRDLDSLGIADLFDVVVNASEVESIKPEPAIYQRALELANIEAHEAFFTDDKAANVVAAEKLGYVGHAFQSPELLKAALVKIGVL
ncbi:MAG: HAD-IA family hydrolase [Chloroflexi bacterium]|nr:HAD-IA family hydrolase [Chloroflexota bacterium]